MVSQIVILHIIVTLVTIEGCGTVWFDCSLLHDNRMVSVVTVFDTMHVPTGSISLFATAAHMTTGQTKPKVASEFAFAALDQRLWVDLQSL